jgi:signal transduction histidine kinase
MKRLFLSLFAFALLAATAAFALDHATPDEAKAMALKAADYLKAAGPDKAFAEFTAKDNIWHDRDLYVTVQDTKGLMLAHGGSAGIVGRSVADLKDVDGKPFTREIAAIQTEAWVTYKWQNPMTKAVEVKSMYAIRVGDYLVGVGAYAQ